MILLWYIFTLHGGKCNFWLCIVLVELGQVSRCNVVATGWKRWDQALVPYSSKRFSMYSQFPDGCEAYQAFCPKIYTDTLSPEEKWPEGETDCPLLTSYYLHIAEHCSRNHQLCSYLTVYQHFMESEGSLPHSQKLTICPYPEQTNPLHITPCYLYKIHLNIIHPPSWSS
jgi:hypothetical protein